MIKEGKDGKNVTRVTVDLPLCAHTTLLLAYINILSSQMNCGKYLLPTEIGGVQIQTFLLRLRMVQ